MLGACLGIALAGASPAFAQAPWWRLNSTAAHAKLPPEGEAQFVVTATNLGDVQVDGSPTPVTFTDELPEGVAPVGLPEAHAGRGVPGHENVPPPLTGCEVAHLQNGRSAVSCKFTEILPPYEQLIMRITAKVKDPSQSPLESALGVQGGNAPPAALTKPLNLQEEPTRFGVETYELTPEDEGGSRDAQAGSHPFQLTTTLDLNQTLAGYSTFGEKGIYPTAPALPRNLRFKLPPGLVGDASAVPQCSKVDFSTPVAENTVNLCPPDTAVGVASLVANDPLPAGFEDWAVPVFNLVPEAGEPARFGFLVEGVPVILRTSVPTGGEYGVQVSVSEISQAVQLLSSQVTLWGVPGDARHDSARGWECLGEGTWYGGHPHSPCATTSEHEQAPTAFLTLPTSCAQVPETSVEGDSWPAGEPGGAHTPEGKETEYEFKTEYKFPSVLSGCGLLPFRPSLSVEPELHSASTPTALAVGVRLPQEGLLAANGLAESAVKETTVTLPEGLQLNPAAANGLQACAAPEFGFHFEGVEESQQTQNLKFLPGFPDCPDASKVGTVEIKTPLLPNPLTGAVYLAEEHTNPFQAPLVIYLVAEDHAAGVLVKLAGTITPNPATGQLTTKFKNTPQLPFEELKLHFFGGPRASLSTPQACGPYAAQTSFIPWSGGTPATPGSSFSITSGVGGGPCPPSPPPFAPSFQAGSTSSQAGAFTSFELEIAHADGDQQLTGVTLHLPPGIAALLSSVTPCEEPAVGQPWACGAESLIGHSTASSGLGSEPYTLAGQAYLTSGYDGAPFGLLVATEAKAGPFDLGMVDVRSRINVDPNTAAVTITADPGPRDEAFPTMIKGVPVQLKRIVVSVDREHFEFNPTSCSPMRIEGTLTGAQGASAAVSSPFQMTDCASLPFAPKLTASVGGRASKANGASLDVKIESAGLGQANIAKVDLQLPKVLPSRLSTLQKACLAATFNANPASCSPESIIGTATIHTPVLKNPLSGPAYLVSRGNAAFPDVEFVLQGEGITLVLDGKTDIKNGITYSRFESAPDAPFTTFETQLPTGPHSALSAYVSAKNPYDLCAAKLTIPTEITAQNGAVIHQATNIAVTGCNGVKAFKATKLTLAQQLANALKKCRSIYKHSTSRRAACEREAHSAYTARAVAACRKSNPHSHAKRAACEAQARRRYATIKATRSASPGPHGRA